MSPAFFKIIALPNWCATILETIGAPCYGVLLPLACDESSRAAFSPPLMTAGLALSPAEGAGAAQSESDWSLCFCKWEFHTFPCFIRELSASAAHSPYSGEMREEAVNVCVHSWECVCTCERNCAVGICSAHSHPVQMQFISISALWNAIWKHNLKKKKSVQNPKNLFAFLTYVIFIVKNITLHRLHSGLCALRCDPLC